jgi:hypothetical protein
MSFTAPRQMLTYVITMYRSALLFLAFLGFGASSASATTITIMSAGTGTAAIPSAVADRNAWILENFGVVATPELLEGFESFDLGAYNTLATGAGTFSVMPGSSPGSASQSNGTKTDQFSILSASNTPFSGRFDTTPGGQKWLDSNDITEIQLSTTQSVLYFFITDVNDSGGRLSIKTADGTTSSGFAPSGKDGNLYFVAIQSSGSIGTVQWLNSSNNDGWGVDDFGTVDPPAAAPEPSGLPMAAAGLGLIAWIWKYKSRAASGRL